MITRDTNSLKAEFARNLQAQMIRKGWNQSELARRANAHLPKPAPGQKRGKNMGRDLVSHYIRGMMLPGPTYLTALAKALEVEVHILTGSVSSVGDSPMEFRAMGEGRAYLRINRTVSMDLAMKIMTMLAEEDKT